MEYMTSACTGRKKEVSAGQTITVIDVEGGQVVNFFAEADAHNRLLENV